MKVNKILKTLLSLIILFVFAIIFSGSVEASRLYSRQSLLEGPNIGNTIMLGIGRYSQTLNLFDENCHLYCVQHRAESETALYVVDAYVNITGKNATGYVRNSGGARTKQSFDNLVLAYLINEEGYYKGYSNEYNNNGVRMRAIHEYLKTWYSNVGFYNNSTKSGLNIDRKWNDSGFSLDNHQPVKQDVLDFIERAKNYAKNYDGTLPSINKNNTSSVIKGLSTNTAGPFKVSYTGKIKSITITDNNGNAINNGNISFSTDKEGKNKVSANNLKSGSNYYIQNSSNATMKNITIKLEDSNVINAQIWFLERNDGLATQRYIMTESKVTTQPGASITIEIKPLISISGYVWVDAPITKENRINNLSDNEEARVAGVKVNLVNKSSKKVEATATTNESGQYTFKKVLIEDELKDYYVEFNYSGTQYKNYIPVAFNSTNANEIVANGSRALVNEMPTADDKVNGIATTYPGTQKENIYGLGGNLYNKLYNNNTKTLENINLGIRQLHTPQYDITENLAYVKLTIKGYTYNYIYGGVDGPNRINAPKVSFQKKNDIAGYTRAIYPSDIVYNPEDATQKLKVSVIYRIDIKNTENQDVEDQYREKKLHITNIVNEFDTSRYDLNDNNWESNGNTATIKQNYLKEKYGNGIEKNQTSTSFIEFSVKEAAIKDILKHPEGIIEEFPTKVTSVGYHEYTRNDYSWKNDLIKEQTHTTPYDQRSSEAPYLIFKLGEQRTLTGTVFEDTVVTNNGEKLGNGTFENNNENVVGNVKVELLDVEEGKTLANLPVSHLYNIKDATDGTKDADITEAMVITDNKGNYTLSGLVPGYYFIRFTYGDGTQKIYDVNGNEVSTVLSKDYKSTIVTSEAARNALGFTDNQYKEVWYKHLEGMNYSVAVDDLDTRKTANTTNTAEKSVNVVAGTAKVSITIENTENDNSTNIEVKDNQQIEVPNKSKFEGFNLGIIRQPNQEAKLEKVVSNMKLTNAQNNIVFDGNPQTAKMQGVSDLDNDKNNGGSAYVRAEIKEENIYGSTLELKYAIKVTNISDVNYYSDNYYKFGDKTNAYEVTLKIEEVTDYLDEALKYEPDESDATRITLTPDSIEETEGDKTTKKYLVKITDWKTLYTENNKERKAQKDTSDAVTLGTQRYLSNEESDMEFVNEAEITKLANQTDPDDNSQDKAEKLVRTAPVEVHTNGKVKAVVTITPPTGLDRITIILYAVAGAVTLAILSAGVVIIKKKVL